MPLKISSFLLCTIFSVGVLAQETETPRIDAEPRWNADVVRDYLKQSDMQSPATAEVPPQPEAVQAVTPPAPPQAATLLHGKEADMVLAKLGKPTLDRRDGRVRLLQFSRPACVLDVVLWRSPASPLQAVHHVESRTAKGVPSDLTTCLKKQYAARGLSYEMAAAPIPPAPPPPVPAVTTTPSSAPLSPAPLPEALPAPTQPQPAPGLSYPLGGVSPPQ
jgi:hypothetical protein